MRSILGVFAALFLFVSSVSAQKPDEGGVSGTVLDQAGHPLEFIAIALKPKAGDKAVRTAVTDARGHFTLESVPFADYRVSYNALGSDAQETPSFTVDAQHRTLDLGKLQLTQTVVKLAAVQVAGTQETFYNSVDRKTYNVGQDIQSSTGSASELLQNIPSVDVDIEGNVSLRGDSNVLILVNGKTSTSMGPNRAAVLEQMPADSIERIEVITNPSAKYKPDGTAGIINITLKKKREPGYTASIRFNAGNSRRFNGGISANYHPGPINFSGSYSVRQDERVRIADDHRQHLDPATNTFLGTTQHTVERSRPLSHLIQAGVDYDLTEDDKLGASFSYNRRTFFRTSDQTEHSFDATGAVTGAYDRLRTDPEFQQDKEYKLTFNHTFPGEGHELNAEILFGNTKEKEDNHYTSVYQIPARPTGFDITWIAPHETNLEATLDYSQMFKGGAKLEAGYALESGKVDTDHFGSSFDPATNTWVTDVAVTNRFIYEPTVNALYATFGQPFGAFGFLAGLRVEQTNIKANQVTAGLRSTNQYAKVFPSLHLKYNLDEDHQLQWNYSHRIQRPDGEDLNPYPEYQDPFNLRAGNPNLRPEEIHSIETGYQYKKEDTSFLATLYYRYRYNGITDVTRYINSTTQLTTKENLTKNTSGGLELAATGAAGSLATFNFSSNVYYNVINASNLGYGAKKSAIAWSSKLSANFHVSKVTLVQFNTSYNAKRLTPQGYRLPNFVTNVGLKHEFAGKNLSMVLTVSDLFDSMAEKTRIDTPVLREEITRRRSARIVYAGLIYNLGKTRKGKDDSIQFDAAP